jgi:hypothetical protein
MMIKDKGNISVVFRSLFSSVFVLLVFMSEGCFNGENKAADQTPWEALVKQNSLWPGETGCWEGYNQGGDPGEYFEYPEYGLRIDYTHPEYYATINPDGSLTKPGYQDAEHQGQASIDYEELLQMCQNIHERGVKICFAMFIHNFEVVGPGALQNFFQNWSSDLKNMGIESIIFIPAWEVQGQWPAWPEGATRDCFISPSAYNSQMAIIKTARDNARAADPNGAEILLGGVLNAWIDLEYPNSDGNTYAGRQYIAGLQKADWVGVDYYPGKRAHMGGRKTPFRMPRAFTMPWGRVQISRYSNILRKPWTAPIGPMRISSTL